MEPSTSSGSNSLELTPYETISKCQVCEKPSHGFHHNALTCRACCAFFRRSCGVHQLWKCKEKNQCKVRSKGNFCRKCRIEKCFKIGMTAENFQYDRDGISYTLQAKLKKKSESLPTSLEKFVGRPHVIIRCEPRTSDIKETLVDLSGLIEKGTNILSKKCTISTEKNCFQKLVNNMKEMRQKKPHGKTVYRKMGQKECMLFWELDFCLDCKMMKYLKCIWAVWALLEKVAFQAEKMMNNEAKIDIVPLDDSATVDMKHLELDLSWCTIYEVDKLRYFLDVYQDCLHLAAISQVLTDLKASDIEVQFMVLQVCFRYAGRRHRKDLLEVSEKLLETVSNQMHDYYSNVLHMRNYSWRIAKLMKCEQIIQEFVKSRYQKIEIAEIFDIFNIQYSHPDMFDDSPFKS